MLVDERGLLGKWKIHSCKEAQDGLDWEQENCVMLRGKHVAQRGCGLPVVTPVAGRWGPRNQSLGFILVLSIVLR